MASTLYALLVGINKYPNLSKQSQLNGCKRDVEKFDAYLRHRIKKENYSYHPEILVDENATRENIIDKFENHLGKAGKGDQALFYYSGHGARFKAPKEFIKLESDGKNESIVPHDFGFGNKGSYSIADKEISALIGKVAEKNPQITIILDCCHSGSGSRNIEVKARQIKDDERTRPIETFLFYETVMEKMKATNGSSSKASNWINWTKGDHVLLAASRPNEFAQELPINGEWGGIFSYSLLKTLENRNGTLSYQDIYAEVSSKVEQYVERQHPKIETTNENLALQPFLGGAMMHTPKNYYVRYKDGRWTVTLGAIHGLQNKRSSLRKSQIEIFDLDTPANELFPDKGLGVAQIVDVGAIESKIKTEVKLNEHKAYKALPIQLPVQSLKVKLEGDSKGIKLVEESILSFSADQIPSYNVSQIKEGETPDFILEASDGGYQIRPYNEEYNFYIPPIEGWDKSQARMAISQLEHIANWWRLKNLQNERATIRPDMFELLIYQLDDDDNEKRLETNKEHQLQYGKIPDSDSWATPRVRIEIKNKSKTSLHFMLLDLTEEFYIGSLEKNWELIDPDGTVYLNDGDSFNLSVPDDYWEMGRYTFNDTLKLIVTHEETSAIPFLQNELTQEMLEFEEKESSKRTVTATKSPKKGWTTLDFNVQIIRPAEAKQIESN